MIRLTTRAALAVGLLVVSAGSIAVVAACGEELPAAETPDASEETGADAANPDGSPLDAGSTCEPEARGPVDAGPEDAACGPNGTSFDLLTSDDHCGFCANACTPGTCKQGACEGVTVATGGQSHFFTGAGTGTHLYFSTNASSCTSGSVRRLALTGPPQIDDLLTENGGGCITWTGIRGDRLYYLRTGTGIHETPLASPVANDKLVVSAGAVLAAHLTQDQLVWQYADSLIQMAPLAGGAPVTIHDDGAVSRIIVFGGDGESVWWVTAPRSDAGPPEETLRTRTVGSNNTAIYETGKVGINRIAFDATHVYLATKNGEVYRRAKEGAGGLELVTTIDATPSFSRSLSVVGDYVFVAVGDPTAPSNAPFQLYRAKKCGGRARMIARDYLLFSEPTPFAGYFYFGRIGELARLQITTPR